MTAPTKTPTKTTETLKLSIVSALVIIAIIGTVMAMIFELTARRERISVQAAAERYGTPGQSTEALTVCWDGKTITGPVRMFNNRELTLETQAGRVTLDPDSVRGGACR